MLTIRKAVALSAVLILDVAFGEQCARKEEADWASFHSATGEKGERANTGRGRAVTLTSTLLLACDRRISDAEVDGGSGLTCGVLLAVRKSGLYSSVFRRLGQR